RRVIEFLLIKINATQVIERLGVGRIGGQDGVDARSGLLGMAIQVAREGGVDLGVVGTILNLPLLVGINLVHQIVDDPPERSDNIEENANDCANDHRKEKHAHLHKR